MLLFLFVVEVELVDEPSVIVEIDTQGTMYYIISDMGAESSLAEGALSIVFWSTAILAIIGLLVPLATFLSCVIGIFMVDMLSNITVDVSALESSQRFPSAFRWRSFSSWYVYRWLRYTVPMYTGYSSGQGKENPVSRNTPRSVDRNWEDSELAENPIPSYPPSPADGCDSKSPSEEGV